MELLTQELTRLSQAYKDTPEQEEKILIPFIKQLLERPMKERRKLLPIIRDLEWIKSAHSTRSCSNNQATFLAATQFVCANRKEMTMGYHLSHRLFFKLLPLYTPAWLEALINDVNAFIPVDLSYESLLQLVDRGYIKELSPARIRERLAFYTHITHGTFNSDLLLKRPITLQEHIWYLFDGVSPLFYIDTSAKDAYKKGDTARDESFSAAFHRFSIDGHMDRDRLLRTTLATFQRGFKKDMTGWFATLFEELQPTTAELLVLQEDMMQTFTNPYTKPVNVMLQQLKKIAAEEGFRYQEFIERSTTLFFSSPKNSLLLIHAIFEQIATLHPEEKEACCTALCQLFLKKDESLQKKAATFILKYGDNSSTLCDTLLAYQPEMLQSIQALLTAYLTQAEEPTLCNPVLLCDELLPTQATLRICREDNRISLPANKEDFLFQLSRLFDMEESWKVDTTIAALIAFHPQLTEEDFSRMEPVFQRAADMVTNSWLTHQDLLATFLLEYQRLLAQEDTTNKGIIKHMFSILEKRLKGIDAGRGAYDERSFKRLADWQPAYSNATCFAPIKQLWLDVIRKMKAGKTLPLLSTPTHSPAYIQATVLVQRLAAYQAADAQPNTWDIQLAIARCAIEDKEEAIAAARQLLTGELLNLCLFLLEEQTPPQPPYIYEAAWIAAGLVKDPDTEYEAFKSFACCTLPHHYLAGNYSWKEPKPKEPNHHSYYTLLQLDFYQCHEYAERNSHRLWQEQLIINSNYNIDDSHYMERLLSLFPNRPEPLIAQIIAHYMDFGSPQEDSKRTVACALRMLLSFHCPLREMSLLLVAGSLLFVDKTVRSYAAELWIEGTATGRIDNHRLGEVLARLAGMELAPLKRFTTQIYESLYKRSSFHNRLLEELLTVFIGRLPDKPVIGLKQLLELYLELLQFNGSRVTDAQVLLRLEEWKQVSNLKKVSVGIVQL